MGQEVAAPIGVRLARPDVPVVALVGDGAVMACLAALPTAVAAKINVVWLIANNTGYASIALYQTKHFGRDAGTYFKDSEGVPYDLDYVAFARSFGAQAERVTDPDEFPGMLARAPRGARHLGAGTAGDTVSAHHRIGPLGCKRHTRRRYREGPSRLSSFTRP